MTDRDSTPSLAPLPRPHVLGWGEAGSEIGPDANPCPQCGVSLGAHEVVMLGAELTAILRTGDLGVRLHRAIDSVFEASTGDRQAEQSEPGQHSEEWRNGFEAGRLTERIERASTGDRQGSLARPRTTHVYGESEPAEGGGWWSPYTETPWGWFRLCVRGVDNPDSVALFWHDSEGAHTATVVVDAESAAMVEHFDALIVTRMMCDGMCKQSNDLRAALSGQGSTPDLRAALATAWDIIEANPLEDTCRHQRDADECPGEADEPCIDRSRRESIRAALSGQGSTPEPQTWAERHGWPPGSTRDEWNDWPERKVEGSTLPTSPDPEA